MSNAVFKITPEPEWPHGAPYSFKHVGHAPNQRLIASALTPRTKSGQTDLRAREVLAMTLFRLNLSKVRRNRRNDPAYGNYRFWWGSLEGLAKDTGLSFDQAKRGMDTLINGGVIYAVRKDLNEPRSYRLTDAAFAMAQSLQYPILRARWEFEQAGHKQPSTVSAVWLMSLDEYAADYAREFPDLVSDLRELFDLWHQNTHATGRKFMPQEFGILDHLDKRYGAWFTPPKWDDE